jgi:signal transduction histidine kinase
VTDQDLLDERLLVLAPTGRDAPLTCRLLGEAGLQALAVGDMDALCAEIERGAAGVLLAEEALLPSALARLVAVLSTQPSWSDLPIVVFTAEAVEARRLRVSMLARLGNLTFLDRPVRPVTMTAAARAALRARQRQYEARRAIEAQELALRQRDQFLAMLGHELRTPLGVILLAGELLESGRDPAQHRAVIMRHARHLSHLVDDLLDVARVTTGKVVLHKRPVELNDLVARSVESLAAAVRAQALEIDVRGAGTDVLVDADPVRLEQVLVNLLGNAVKYTPRGGHIEVRVTVEHGQALFSVCDDGIGIAPDMLPRIFDLFAQADLSLDRAQVASASASPWCAA